jgi:hypothetical protein
MTAEEKAKELYHKPYPEKSDDYVPNMFAMQSRKDFIAGANWQASQHEWVKCSERLPKFSDGDADDLVDVARWSSYEKRWVRCAAMHWANLQMYPDFIWCKRNVNFPEPPKTEI